MEYGSSSSATTSPTIEKKLFAIRVEGRAQEKKVTLFVNGRQRAKADLRYELDLYLTSEDLGGNDCSIMTEDCKLLTTFKLNVNENDFDVASSKASPLECHKARQEGLIEIIRSRPLRRECLNSQRIV